MALDLKQHITHSRCREWICEYILKHCSNNYLTRALVAAYPIPDNCPRLKRMLLLKYLSFDLDEDRLSDKTLGTISLLLKFYKSENIPLDFHALAGCKVMFTLPDLLLAVRAECSVQYLRKETDDWSKFNASLEKLWGLDQQGARDAEVDKDRFLELKHELWAVRIRPHLRHDLLKKYDREFVKLMIKGFLSDAWQRTGSVFLEQMAEKIEEDLCVSRGLQHTSSPTVKKIQCMDDVPPQLQRHTNLSAKLRRTPVKSPIDQSSLTVVDKRSSSEIMEKRLHDVALESPVDVSCEVNEVVGSGRGIVDLRKYQKRPHEISNTEQIESQNRERIPVNVLDKSGQKLKVTTQLINELQVRTSFHKSAHMQAVTIKESSKSLLNDQFAGERLVPSECEDTIGVLTQEEKAYASQSPWAEYVDIVNPGNSNTLGPLEIQRAPSALPEGQASLIGVVKDRLPLDGKIADEVAKSGRCTGKATDLSEEALHVNEHNGGQEFVSEPCRKELIVVASSNRKIMERNPTAQTIEWETSDDIAASSDENSPSESSKMHLPRIHRRQCVNKLPSHNVPRNRKFRKWPKEEEDVLSNEVERGKKAKLMKTAEVIEISDSACNGVIEGSDAGYNEVIEGSDAASTVVPDCVDLNTPVTDSGIDGTDDEVNLRLREIPVVGLPKETTQADAECQLEANLGKAAHDEKDLIGLGSNSTELKPNVENDKGRCIRKVVNVGHLFKCVRDPIGKKARVCIAAPSCVAKSVYIYRRDAMERHLLQAHNIYCFVPGGFRMEDVGNPTGTSVAESRDKRRSRERFFDAERKYCVARRKFEKGVRLKAQEIYSQLPAELRPLPEDRFMEAYIEEQMKVYDSRKEEKMKRIKERIMRGYECYTRDGRASVRHTTTTLLDIQTEHTKR